MSTTWSRTKSPKRRVEPTRQSGDPSFAAALRKRLVRWYRRHARDLPWRRTRDPYAIWISETMLQQTQVATVIPYYERFLAAFPTIRELADAPESSVLRLWEGLGYYRRARQLHRAAKELVEQHGGQFPRDLDSIQALPGIGRYTAGAIASFAFDLPAPIVEANTLRLYCRMLAYRGDPRSALGQRLLWETAESWLPKRGAGEFNQALMELGSTVCKIREPDCDRCPLALLCPTRAKGLQNDIPAAARPMRFESVTDAAVVVRRGDRVLLVKRGERERWAGLWDFPRFALSATSANDRRRELVDKVHEVAGVEIALGSKIATLKHGVTRFRITLECFEAEPTSKPVTKSTTRRWVRIHDLDDFAMSVTGRKLAKILASNTNAG